jgi:hypothetical protein
VGATLANPSDGHDQAPSDRRNTLHRVTEDNDQPSIALGAGVHEYYARYIDNADAKTGALLTLDAAGIAALFASFPTDATARAAVVASLGFAVLSLSACLHAIYPRLPSGGDSPIFWKDVRDRWPTAEAYADHITALDHSDADRVWAVNNYHVAGVLNRKFQDIQVAIIFSTISLAAASLSLILR